MYFYDWIIYHTWFIQLLSHVCIISYLVYKIWFCTILSIWPVTSTRSITATQIPEFWIRIHLQSPPFDRLLLQRPHLSLKASSDKTPALIKAEVAAYLPQASESKYSCKFDIIKVLLYILCQTKVITLSYWWWEQWVAHSIFYTAKWSSKHPLPNWSPEKTNL